jgi:hypothetical protein
VRAHKIGRRNAPFARYALLLFEDRVEEVSYTLSGLEVKRFFFDEADFMTVHRLSNVAEVALAVLVMALLVVLAVASSGNAVAVWIFGSLAALMLAVAALLVYFPPWKLVLAAPSPETVECLLPRGRGRREEALGLLTRAIARYQSRTARAAGPAPDATPPPPAA